MKKFIGIALIGCFLVTACAPVKVPPGQAKKTTAPGQIKKATGSQSAKSFAPGQQKKTTPVKGKGKQ